MRTNVEFLSRGTCCRGAHLAPATDEFSSPSGTPCVIMAAGFGGTLNAGLESFGEAYAAAGLHALLFDYRHFGVSDGEPRQLISISRQLQDWGAALAYARTIPGVDPDRIVLVGTSFSGGHVIEAGVRDRRVAAVISQCPMLDGRAAMVNVARYAGVGYLFRILREGIRDAATIVTGQAPSMVPIVGPPGSVAAMTSPDAEPGFMAIAPPDFRNEICARIGLTMGFYRPGRKTDRLRCPLLVCVCEKDSIAPAAAAEAAARRAGDRAELVRYPIGHFEIYTTAFDTAIADHLAFLRRHLGHSG